MTDSAPDTHGLQDQDQATVTAATPEALVESVRIDAQSEYGRGWNKGMADAVALLRSEGWLRETPEETANDATIR